MDAVLECAHQNDIEELLDLYRLVYGSTYALPLGTDPEVMAAEIASPTTQWLVAREKPGNRLVGSIVAAVEPAERLAKLQGLIVHPQRRSSGLGDRLVAGGSEAVLAADSPVDSLYGTARTTSTAPQRICLRNGFRALGMFPNLRKATRHETMVLLVRYRAGVLDRRLPTERVPAGLARLVAAVDDSLGAPHRTIASDVDVRIERGEASAGLELIDAPAFVRRRFHEVVREPRRRFYPFHSPNILISAQDGSYEVYAHLSRSDGYCALLAAAPTASAVAAHLDELIARLADCGASYLETLVPLDAYDELCALLAHGFLPAAAYPAMRRDGAGYRDYVVMARTLQPLNFQGLSIDSAFRPFIDQYIDLWTTTYLNTREVFR